MKLPKVTQEPILHIDLTPNDNLPLRILRVYRENCNCSWAEDTDGGEVKNPVLILMNQNNKQRATILDRAIKILEQELPIQEG